MNKIDLTIREIVEMAMLVALAVVLNYKLFNIPIVAHEEGGSIGISMIPLFILAYRHGVIKGFLGAGIVYGILAILMDSYNIATFPFDYLFASGSIALAGLWRKTFLPETNKNKTQKVIAIVLSVLLCGTLKFISHFISGLIVYNATVAFSFSYNITYCAINTGIALIILLLLLPAITTINRLYPVNKRKAYKTEE